MRAESRWYGGNMEFCDEYGSVVGVMRAGDTFGEAALEFAAGYGTRYAHPPRHCSHLAGV